jgi:hypothetical protein
MPELLRASLLFERNLKAQQVCIARITVFVHLSAQSLDLFVIQGFDRGKQSLLGLLELCVARSPLV